MKGRINREDEDKEEVISKQIVKVERGRGVYSSRSSNVLVRVFLGVGGMGDNEKEVLHRQG